MNDYPSPWWFIMVAGVAVSWAFIIGVVVGIAANFFGVEMR